MASKPVIQLSPLALSVIFDARTRMSAENPLCLCTLLGNISDDGIINVKDAFATNAVEDSDGLITPQLLHYDSMISLIVKSRTREFVVGWGTTNMNRQQMQNLNTWAKNDHKIAKFIVHKKFLSPLLLFVNTLECNDTLGCEAYIVINDVLTQLDIIYKPLIPYNFASKFMNISTMFTDMCIGRINEAIKVCEKAQKTGNIEVAKNLRKAISISIGKNMEEIFATIRDEKELYNCMCNLANIEIALCKQLMKLTQ